MNLLSSARTPGAARRPGAGPLAALLLALALALCTACSVPHIIVHEDALSPEEHLKLGLSYEKDGELDLAEKEYRKALPDAPQAYLSLANLYFGEEKWQLARENYEKAIERLPDDPEPRNNLAWLIYTRQGDLAEAEALAKKAVELSRTPEERAQFEDTLNRIEAARAQ
ncbi:Tetratricopeptide TPR_2 repeat-containing protein [Desulfovibrio sp. X2]|uniref:tetratricopeptide repeat protein n=1 Tax=Desulfovibrio sp. X2 TaxID=941449 RepID=UPI000358D35E|nr:tetratricopeptide repeat protein [Desulfovibrio sp. X2]EPR43711.1 Tetratricopeptide TPR_2 repeat-containing protein [Desulfovibrio sp. X2]